MEDGAGEGSIPKHLHALAMVGHGKTGFSMLTGTSSEPPQVGLFGSEGHCSAGPPWILEWVPVISPRDLSCLKYTGHTHD